MNWNKVIHRGSDVITVVCILGIVFFACWLMYLLYANAPLYVFAGITGCIIASLVYVFWGSWKE